jgi:hypothetical protein
MMGKKLKYTPRSRIRAALRQLFLRSRERAEAEKRDNRTCQCCGKKKSVAKGKEVKIVVHHKNGILNWDKLIDAVYQYLLCDSSNMEVLCVDCHKKEHLKEI